MHLLQNGGRCPELELKPWLESEVRLRSLRCSGGDRYLPLNGPLLLKPLCWGLTLPSLEVSLDSSTSLITHILLSSPTSLCPLSNISYTCIPSLQPLFCYHCPSNLPELFSGFLKQFFQLVSLPVALDISQSSISKMHV